MAPFLKDPEKVKQIKVLYVTDPITGDTMATTKKFMRENPEIVSKTKQLLVDMGKDPEGKKLLYALYRMDSMVPAEPKDYDAVRDAAKVLNVMQ